MSKSKSKEMTSLLMISSATGAKCTQSSGRGTSASSEFHSHAIGAPFIDDVVSSVALRALITTSARPVQPKGSTQLNTVC